MRRVCVMIVCLSILVGARTASGQQLYKTGSLIIPMDVDYQDSGMLLAYGLLYKLLKAGVPVHWVIKYQKKLGDADLTTTAKDFKSGAAIASHGYRGGPFVVEDTQATKAGPVITAWQTAHPTVTVHIAQQDFTARAGRVLSAAPTIAVIADGAQGIAYAYMNAAGIPDRNGSTWSNASPDVLDTLEIQGPSTTNHHDGALFRTSGQPAYCQIMTMHWGVNNVVDAVVAEYRTFLTYPTHMMAECQAVNAIENNIYGHFITTSPVSDAGVQTGGFDIDNNVKDTGPFEYLNLDTPFVQFDGVYNLVGGSERAYSLKPGTTYADKNVVMIKDAATTFGQRSVWMTGYLNGTCTLSELVDGGKICTAGVGKVSYLGGHQYTTNVPISKNPDTQGTRLFLNSLFEASCTTAEGQPVISLQKTGPAWTTSGQVTYSLSYSNAGPGPALDLTIEDTLPAGVSFVSASGGGSAVGSKVTWKIGDVGAASSGTVQLTVSFASYGTYSNSFSGTFLVGVSSKTVTSNTVQTSYQATAPLDAGPSFDAKLGDGPREAKVGDAAKLGDGAGKDAPFKLDGGSKDWTGKTDGAFKGDGNKDAVSKDGVVKTDGKGNLDGVAKRDGGAGGDRAGKSDGSVSSDRGTAGDGAGAVDGTGSRDKGGGSPGSSSGGCNCNVAVAQSGPESAALLGIGLALVALLRRRRRAAR